MSRKLLKVRTEVKFSAISCPGVYLPAKDDVYLSMCFMGQYRQSKCLPAYFPLLFKEKLTFEKILRYAIDPGDIAVMLEYELVRIELVQLTPPDGDVLAYFEEDARRFLFPEPKLVPSFSGVEREVLMTTAPHFPGFGKLRSSNGWFLPLPVGIELSLAHVDEILQWQRIKGIAPRLEFSTKTTICECSSEAEICIHPNNSMKLSVRRSKKRGNKTSTSCRNQSKRAGDSHSASSLPAVPRSRSLSPLRAQRVTQVSLDSAAPNKAKWNQIINADPLQASWPGALRSSSTHHSGRGTDSSLLAFDSTGRHSSASQRKHLTNGLVEEESGEDDDPSDTSYTHGLLGQRSTNALTSDSRSLSSSHDGWDEIQERVRSLLTTPKALRRLICGATDSEVEEVLARQSIYSRPH